MFLVPNAPTLATGRGCCNAGAACNKRQHSDLRPIPLLPLQPSIARHTTGVWTRTYLEQQLQMALAGRAAEEVLFGPEELSSLNQHRLMFARQVSS